MDTARALAALKRAQARVETATKKQKQARRVGIRLRCKKVPSSNPGGLTSL
jgi:hypothetical protein